MSTFTSAKNNGISAAEIISPSSPPPSHPSLSSPLTDQPSASISRLVSLIQPLVAEELHELLGISMPELYRCNDISRRGDTEVTNVDNDSNGGDGGSDVERLKDMKEGFANLLPGVNKDGECLLLSRNTKALLRKIEAFRLAARNESESKSSSDSDSSKSSNGLQVVTDFDYTMTKLIDYNHSSSSTTTTRLCSCHKVIEDCGLLTGDYESKARALQQHYYPLEVDPTLSMEEKIIFMQEWVVKAHHLFVEYGLTRSIVDGAVSRALGNRTIQLRPGVPAFFKQAKERGVKVSIFSAGLYDVIEKVLAKDELFSPLIDSKELVEGREFDIISNRCLFEPTEAREKVLSLSEPMIHVFNKRCSQHLQHPMVFACNSRNRLSSSISSSSSSSSALTSRVLLIGDSPGDVNMSEGLDCGSSSMTTRSSSGNGFIKVGFLNDLVADRLSGFLDIFDLVILGDGSFEPLNKLLAKLDNQI